MEIDNTVYEENEDFSTTSQRCLVLSIVGPSNAGKSTFVNCLMGKKISIVTHKVQTTRSIIRAILTEEDIQLVFLDTPGIFRPRTDLEKITVKNAWSGLRGGDLIVLIVDSVKGITENVQHIIKNLKGSAVVVLNKVDLVSKPTLLTLAAEINKLYDFDKTFMVSAFSGNGMQDVKNYFKKIAPSFPWLFNDKKSTDAPDEFILAEITREKIFLRAHHEIPYSIAVETEQIKEKDGAVFINQVIYVMRESQKKILIGKGGKAIASIREAATHDMSIFLSEKVVLMLYVKVRKNWPANVQISQSLSYF